MMTVSFVDQSQLWKKRRRWITKALKNNIPDRSPHCHRILWLGVWFNSILESQVIKKDKNKSFPNKKMASSFFKEKTTTVSNLSFCPAVTFIAILSLPRSFSHPLMQGFPSCLHMELHFGNEHLIKWVPEHPLQKLIVLIWVCLCPYWHPMIWDGGFTPREKARNKFAETGKWKMILPKHNGEGGAEQPYIEPLSVAAFCILLLIRNNRTE